MLSACAGVLVNVKVSLALLALSVNGPPVGNTCPNVAPGLAGLMYLANEFITTVGVSFVPSSHVASVRRWNTIERPSIFQDVARYGMRAPDLLKARSVS